MQIFWNNLPRPFFVLAPMEQVTDVVFRHVVQKAGAPDVFYTEFANATGWVHAGNKGIGGRLIKTNDEHPIVAQIWGGEPGDLEQFAMHCAKLGYDGIDINMGCPAKSAVKSGGAALIRQPDLAAKAIAAAKKAGLPVSVKTRLGYSSINEWREWLTHILQQDIVTLTIHLRSKKEMSKVPAHWELIPEIKALRDQIAPNTLLVINGDIKDRAEGEKLAAQYGVDGIMIGRGIFTNPFCFAGTSSSGPATSRPLPRTAPLLSSLPLAARKSLYAGLAGRSAPSFEKSEILSKAGATPPPVTRLGVNVSTERRSAVAFADFLETEPSEDPGTSARPGLRAGGVRSGREAAAPGESVSGKATEKVASEEHKQQLIDLLHYHLGLYDQYCEQTHRPFETLKRFFKIYIRDFAGASELREKLMHTKSTDEVRALLNDCL